MRIILFTLFLPIACLAWQIQIDSNKVVIASGALSYPQVAGSSVVDVSKDVCVFCQVGQLWSGSTCTNNSSYQSLQQQMYATRAATNAVIDWTTNTVQRMQQKVFTLKIPPVTDSDTNTLNILMDLIYEKAAQLRSGL